MQEYDKQHSIKDVPRRLLIGSYLLVKNRTRYAIIKILFRTRACHYMYLRSHRIYN